jgi:hypothetical protein
MNRPDFQFVPSPQGASYATIALAAAVAMACNPPRPRCERTRAGLMVPAAVVSIRKMRGSASAEQHRLITAIVACSGVHRLCACGSRDQLHRKQRHAPAIARRIASCHGRAQ